MLGASEQAGEQLLPASSLWLVAVLPTHQGRERHQNRFGAAIGLEAKNGAAIEHQVEFHIATAAIQLELALPVAIGDWIALLDDRCIAGQEAVATG